jgi:hypothetical protein
MTPQSAAERPPILLHEGQAWPLADGEHVIGRGEEAALRLAVSG